LKEPISS